MSNDIITVDTAAQGAGGKWVYHDTAGKRWVSWPDKIVLVEKKSYEIQEMKPNKWSPKNAPEKTFTDYVITKAKEVAAPTTPSPPLPVPKSNGNAQTNGRQKWDKDEVLSARLSLIIGGWAQSGQIAIDGASVARALWALDNGLQIYNDPKGPLYDPGNNSENPSDGMEGTEFGR